MQNSDWSPSSVILPSPIHGCYFGYYVTVMHDLLYGLQLEVSQRHCLQTHHHVQDYTDVNSFKITMTNTEGYYTSASLYYHF